MADITQSIANTSGFIPSVWAQRALDVLRSNIVFCNLVSMDKDFTPGWQGQTLNIGYPGTFTATAKAANTALTPQAPSGGATVQVTLDHHEVVPFLVEDFAAALANGTLYERYIEPAAIALAEQVETDLISNYTNFATANQIGTSGTDVSYATIIKAEQTLNAAKVPLRDRFFLLSTKDKAAVQQDTNLQHYFDYKANEAITEGRIGRLANFDFYWSQLAPANANFAALITPPGSSTFTTTTAGITSAAVAFNATTATYQTALNTAFGAGNLLATGADGGPWTVTKIGTLIGDTTAITVSAGTSAAKAFTPTRSLALQKQAILLAVRPFTTPPAGSGVMTTVVTDPDSGLSLRLSAQYDINNVGVRMNLDILYGYKTLRPTFGVVVQS